MTQIRVIPPPAGHPAGLRAGYELQTTREIPVVIVERA